MKKIYTIATAILLAGATHAQTTENFDNFTLATESYDNGSAGGGAFVFGPISLDNSYDDTWGSWTGFSISNVTDNTTAGYANQYGVYTAAAYSGSNFAMFYSTGGIQTTAAVIDSFKITNSTYAGISMRDGDAFSKQFGSPNGADGNPDGTNGEDFFKVWVICSNYDGTITDSVEFFLADYRFANNNDDYIVDSWENVDVSGFAFDVASINFRLESSDIGQWGMNTPAYFAIDDVTYRSTAGINEMADISIAVYPNPFNDQIIVNGDAGKINVFNASGQIVFTGFHNNSTLINTSEWNSGVFFVQLTTPSGVKTTKLVK